MTLSQASIDALLQGAAQELGEEPSPPPAPAPPPPPATAAPARAPARAAPTQRAAPDLRRILRLTVQVAVVLAERELSIESVLDVKPGTIVEFDVAFDADLTLVVAGHRIGAGQAVKIGENFGLRLTEIQDVRDRIEAMGGD